MAVQNPDPRRAAGSDRIPSESGDRVAATGALSWHLVSAAVIALMATGFLALLDAQPLGGGEVSQEAARRADMAGDPAAVARSAAEKLRPPGVGEARAERLAVKPQQVAAPPAPEAPKPRVQEARVPEARTPEARRPEVTRPPAGDIAAPRSASPAPAAPAAVVASTTPAPLPPPSPIAWAEAPPPASPAAAPGLPSFARDGAASPLAPSTPLAAAEPAVTASIDSPAGKAAAPAAEKAPSSRLVAVAGAPLQCLPAELKNVLNDVAERFGTTTVVSTTHLHTDNHSDGSARAKMHANCKAVDFKVGSQIKAVTAYLRTRKEVAGINSYRNGVIHIDMNPNFKTASKPADFRKTGKSASR